MMKAIVFVALLTAASFSALAANDWPTLPDPQLTPGKARSDLSAYDICNKSWGEDQRHVTQSMKDNVVAACNFDVTACPFTVFKGKRQHRGVLPTTVLDKDLAGFSGSAGGLVLSR